MELEGRTEVEEYPPRGWFQTSAHRVEVVHEIVQRQQFRPLISAKLVRAHGRHQGFDVTGRRQRELVAREQADQALRVQPRRRTYIVVARPYPVHRIRNGREIPDYIVVPFEIDGVRHEHAVDHLVRGVRVAPDATTARIFRRGVSEFVRMFHDVSLAYGRDVPSGSRTTVFSPRTTFLRRE